MSLSFYCSRFQVGLFIWCLCSLHTLCTYCCWLLLRQSVTVLTRYPVCTVVEFQGWFLLQGSNFKFSRSNSVNQACRSKILLDMVCQGREGGEGGQFFQISSIFPLFWRMMIGLKIPREMNFAQKYKYDFKNYLAS